MLRLAISLIAILGLTGCASSRSNFYEVGAALNGPALKIPPEMTVRFAAETDATPPARRASLRREMVFALIADSDRKCENYLVGVSAYANSTRSGLGALGLAFSTAGGVASTEGSANLLSSLSTLATGTESVLSDSIMAGKDFPILYAAVRNGRRADRERMFDATNRGAFDTWGPYSIHSYVNAYDMNCGINYALEQIASAVQAQGDLTRRELNIPGVASNETIAGPQAPQH